jgi:hypothetical protein
MKQRVGDGEDPEPGHASATRSRVVNLVREHGRHVVAEFPAHVRREGEEQQAVGQSADVHVTRAS